MKINEIIRERRIAKGYTQEQLADYLGVSAPAISKWETAASYPDITLLPALARLLDTDLNTLLSFKEDLLPKEISLFLNQLSSIAEQDGIKSTYQTAMEKIREFPSCHALILNVALFLEGAIMMSAEKDVPEDYMKSIETLYQRVLESPDMAIQNQAKAMLISKYRQRKEYEKAQELLQSLPDESQSNKKQIQAQLYLETENLEAATKLMEEQLLTNANDIHYALITLMEIALKENRMEDAEYIATVSQKGAEIFDMWEYNSYVAHFQLYIATKERKKCLKVLMPMLKSLTHAWNVNESPLYRHIEAKKASQDFGSKMKKTILNSLATDEKTAFLRNDTEFQKLIKEIDK